MAFYAPLSFSSLCVCVGILLIIAARPNNTNHDTRSGIQSMPRSGVKSKLYIISRCSCLVQFGNSQSDTQERSEAEPLSQRGRK
nr:hypothetical protein Q903MT_gene5354 [Picea sitchensis]